MYVTQHTTCSAGDEVHFFHVVPLPSPVILPEADMLSSPDPDPVVQRAQVRLKMGIANADVSARGYVSSHHTPGGCQLTLQAHMCRICECAQSPYCSSRSSL